MKRKIKYKRYTFFRKGDGYYRNGRTTLHRYKYERKYGAIFPYFHLHHIDGNKYNNCLSNLKMLTPQEHASEHRAMRWEKMFKNQLKLSL